METKIIGFSGKMQAGKDSACNLLYCIALKNVLKLTGSAYVNEDGKIVVEYDDEGGNKFEQVLYVDSRNHEIRSWMAQMVWPFIRKFSYAEPLKEFGQYVLGLSEESVWGTNEQKNQPTHLKWEDMPTVISNDTWEIMQHKFSYKQEPEDILNNILVGKTGYMTGREVMEYFGSQICRKMYSNIWADALIRRIQLVQPQIATVCDIRFPNEVEAIKSVGGKVIRLTRTTDEAAKNTHISNTALDDNVYDWSNFDAVIDNQNLSIEDSQALILNKLIEWDIMKLEEIDNVV